MTGLGRMTAPLPPLCGPCLAEMGRWLDTSPEGIRQGVMVTFEDETGEGLDA